MVSVVLALPGWKVLRNELAAKTGVSMGTSYEGLLVVSDQAVVVDALTDAGVAALVTEAAPGRVAVSPKEDARWDVADVVTVATLLSAGTDYRCWCTTCMTPRC